MALWDVTLYIVVEKYQHFGEATKLNGITPQRILILIFTAIRA
jgi:hypothetical protein